MQADFQASPLRPEDLFEAHTTGPHTTTDQAAIYSIAISLKRLADAAQPQIITGSIEPTPCFSAVREG